MVVVKQMLSISGTKQKTFRIILSALIVMAAMLVPSARLEAVAKMPSAKIGNQVVKLEVAQTDVEIQRGLMYRTSMEEDAGMVFIFSPPKAVRFWMYHTLIPLDMLFIRNGEVVKIFHHVPPCKSENPRDCPTYPRDSEIEVDKVIELNGGYCKRHQIKEGDKVEFSL